MVKYWSDKYLALLCARNSQKNMHKKPNLPSKICPSCDREFVWRKKWYKVWDDVRYCSNLCRKKKPTKNKPEAR